MFSSQIEPECLKESSDIDQQWEEPRSSSDTNGTDEKQSSRLSDRSVLTLFALCVISIFATTYLLVYISPNSKLINTIINELQRSRDVIGQSGISDRGLEDFRVTVKLRPDNTNYHKEYYTNDTIIFQQLQQIYTFFPRHHSINVGNSTYRFLYAGSFDHTLNAIANYKMGKACNEISDIDAKSSCRYLQRISQALDSLTSMNSLNQPMFIPGYNSSQPVDQLVSYQEIEILELIEAYLQSMIEVKIHKKLIYVYGKPFNELILNHRRDT